MPLYAYTCTACGHSFDIHQSFADDALTVCPECEGRLRKVFSPVGVVFKGSGFYRTDNKKSTSSAPSSPKTSSETPSSSSSESSAASTPAKESSTAAATAGATAPAAASTAPARSSTPAST